MADLSTLCFDLGFNLSTDSLPVWNLSLDSLSRSMNSSNMHFDISTESPLQVDRNSDYEPIYPPGVFTGLDASVLSNHDYASPGPHQNASVSSFNLSSGMGPTYPPSSFTGVGGDSPLPPYPSLDISSYEDIADDFPLLPTPLRLQMGTPNHVHEDEPHFSEDLPLASPAVDLQSPSSSVDEPASPPPNIQQCQAHLKDVILCQGIKPLSSW